jgi:bifunctional DNase/RNase
MSRKVEVFIKNILPAHSHGAYTLVLHSPSSKIQLPVLIGAFEAQSIAMEMENMKSNRPLTHDLFATTLKNFNIKVDEICIERLEEGIYYSNIYFSMDGLTMQIDSRTSDAIALAMKFKCPIFVTQHILDEAGFEDDEKDGIEDIDTPGRTGEDDAKQEFKEVKNPLAEFTLTQLKQMLDEAIAVEDYSKAARLRDEIAKRK